MYGDWLEVGRTLMCLVLSGATIKLMDDYLDAEYDICRGKHTLAVKLSRATLPYALVLGFLAAYLNLNIAISVFFGSYAVGMLTTWREKLPTRLPAFVEILLALALSAMLVGWRTALWGACLMAMFDWLDDLVDRITDEKTGQRNMALRIGVVETTLLTLMVMCAAILLSAWWTALGFIALAMLTMLSEATTSTLWQALDEDKGVHL
jgi:1,4-dihydroxy-2-naphthoate octaprenyltransferase